MDEMHSYYQRNQCNLRSKLIPLGGMDELKIIIWIVIGLVYLISRRKRKPTPPPPSRPTESRQEHDAPEPKPVSFEELLREIQGMKKPEPAPRSIPMPRSYEQPPEKKEWEPYDYEDEVVEEKKQLEDANYDYRKQDKIYDIYDNATKQAFVRPSLEETMKLDETIVRFNQFKEYKTDTKHNLMEEYVKELKDPKGFKKAFIMSEILQRRFWPWSNPNLNSAIFYFKPSKNFIVSTLSE